MEMNSIGIVILVAAFGLFALLVYTVIKSLKSIRAARQKTLYFRDDRLAQDMKLPLMDRLLLRKQAKPEGWPFLPSLLLPVKVNGKDRGEYYLVAARTGEPLDPLMTLNEEWKGKKLWSKVCDVAEEEHDASISKQHESPMDKAGLPISIASGIWIFGLFIKFVTSKGG